MKTMSTSAGHVSKTTDKQKRQRDKARKEGIAAKTFEELNNPQKDALLKQIGVQLGLIKDSD